MKTYTCRTSLLWIALLCACGSIVPWSQAWAEDEITIIDPAAGSSYRAGAVMRITIEMAADAPWGAQVFDLSINNGINSFSSGVILEDSVREKKHYDWEIPIEIYQRGEYYSPVNDSCRILIFPYQKDSSQPYGSTGKSEIFSIQPASSIRMSAWSPVRSSGARAAIFAAFDASEQAHEAQPRLSLDYSINGRMLTPWSRQTGSHGTASGTQMVLIRSTMAR